MPKNISYLHALDALPKRNRTIFALIKSFPCLSRKVGKWLARAETFNPDDFRNELEGASSTEWQCALFVLNAWSTSYSYPRGLRFDLFEFLRHADDQNLKAFQEWAADPYTF
jgi:hypothetical protein